MKEVEFVWTSYDPPEDQYQEIDDFVLQILLPKPYPDWESSTYEDDYEDFVEQIEVEDIVIIPPDDPY